MAPYETRAFNVAIEITFDPARLAAHGQGGGTTMCSRSARLAA